MKQLLSSLAVILFLLTPQMPNAKDATVRHWNHSRGYEPFSYATPEGIKIDNTSPAKISDSFEFSNPTPSFSLSFRASNLHAHPSKKFSFVSSDNKSHRRSNPEWQFFITAGKDTLWITIKSEEISDAISSSQAVRIYASFNSNENQIASYIDTGNLDCFSGPNLWNLTATPNGVRIDGGHSHLTTLLDIPFSFQPFSGFGFAASPAACLSVSDITLTCKNPVISPLTSWCDMEHLRDYLKNSTDPLEGYWVIFDRTLEESLLLLGGDYRMAIVRDNDRYLIIYLSGARINADKWESGMIKGVLTPDPFPGVYSVEWIDAEGESMSHDIKGQTGEGNTLSVQFPYQSSTLRLRRIP